MLDHAHALRVVVATLALLRLLAAAAPARAEHVSASLGGETRLELSLREARAERAAVSRLWPVLTFAAGASAVAVGSSAGIVRAIGCDGECGTLPWVSAAVVIGAAIGTVGAVWWLRTNRELDGLDSKVARITREIERARTTPRERREQAAAARPALRLRWSF